jgi:ribonuclease G
MSKELIVSSSPHETRVAILEEGQLCEIYIEREKEYALVGSIYKGRVTRVLPGMQSAFVDIGLDTDAFLYVSDVLEELEEYDHVPAAAENHARPAAPVAAAPVPAIEAPAVEPPAVEPPAEEAPAVVEAQPAPPVAESQPPRFERGGRPDQRRGGRFDRRGDRFGGRRGRRGRRGGRELPASKYAPSSEPAAPEEPGYEPIILPGESLAKYKGRAPSAAAGTVSAARDEETFPVREEEITVAPESPAAAAFTPPVETRPVEVEAETETESPREEENKTAAETSDQGRSSVAEEAPAAETSEVDVVDTETVEPAGNGAEAASAEETASVTETLAENRQAEVFQRESGEENGEEQEAKAASSVETELDDSVGPGNELVPEPESEPEPETEVDSGPQPGNEITSVRIEQPSRSRLQRPAGRDRHRGGRRHRQNRDRDRDRDRSRGDRSHHPHHHAPPRRVHQISDLLKAGQEVIVQINKEPLGKKGARITSHIALPGRFLVYMPTLDHIGISRKIGTSDTRGRLRRLVDELRHGHPGGFIARTAAGNATEEDIRADAEYLTRTWQEIRAKSEQRRAPSLLHRDLNLVERLLRDCLNRDYSAVWVDSEDEYTRIVDFVSRFQPDLVNRIKLYTKETPIFEEMGVQQEIDKSLRPKVWLKSGGYIVINHTEALVAIDINTGKYVGRGSNRLEDTIVKTNIDAIKEIVRQIRLRDLGGIIVIDFIDMEERRNREKVLQALEDALRQDRAPSKVLPFNEFGLVAITRKRTKQALERVLCQPCPYCTGSGMVKSVPTICYEIENEARKMAGELDAPSLTLRVHPEIAKALKTREAGLIEELERATHKNVLIQSDATLHWEQYDIY